MDDMGKLKQRREERKKKAEEDKKQKYEDKIYDGGIRVDEDYENLMRKKQAAMVHVVTEQVNLKF
jgi:hypothetical protein